MTGNGEDAQLPQEEPYASLAPELQQLTGDPLRLWSDAAERRAAVDAILRSLESGGEDLARSIARLDSAIVIALDVVGLPRGRVRDVRVEVVGRGWLGHKRADSILLIDAEIMRHLPQETGPDTVFRTWVHESVHGRQPISFDRASELRIAPGYEEGLAEGLARLLTRVCCDAATGSV